MNPKLKKAFDRLGVVAKPLSTGWVSATIKQGHKQVTARFLLDDTESPCSLFVGVDRKEGFGVSDYDAWAWVRDQVRENMR